MVLEPVYSQNKPELLTASIKQECDERQLSEYDTD